MTCYREEIFGPCLVCVDADSLDDAVALINANEYGNGVAVFTRSGASAGRFQREVEAGQVGVNIPIPVPIPVFSFSGNKSSVAGGGANTFYGESFSDASSVPFPSWVVIVLGRGVRATEWADHVLWLAQANPASTSTRRPRR